MRKAVRIPETRPRGRGAEIKFLNALDKVVQTR